MSALDLLSPFSVLPAAETLLGGPAETKPLTVRWEDTVPSLQSNSADGSPMLPYSASTAPTHQFHSKSLSFDSANPNIIQNPPIRPPKSPIEQIHPVETAWETGGRNIAKHVMEDQGLATSLHLTPKYIVIALNNAQIYVFDTDGKNKMTLPGHVMGVWAITPWGDTLVSGGSDRDVKVWDMSTG
jgi:F-box and WD-40 domain protein CDC4